MLVYLKVISPTPGGIIPLNYRRVSGSSAVALWGLRLGGPHIPLLVVASAAPQPRGGGGGPSCATRVTTDSSFTTANFLQFLEGQVF